MANTTGLEYNKDTQEIITSTTKEEALFWADKVVVKSYWRAATKWHYPDNDMDRPYGRIFLSENENSSDNLNFASHNRLFDNSDYAYPAITQPENSKMISQVVLSPVGSGRYLLEFECYLEDNKTFCPLQKVIEREEVVQIVAWCIQNKKRVYDYAFCFFSLALGEYVEAELQAE